MTEKLDSVPDTPSFTVSNLRQRPDFARTAAKRVWHAWWKEDGVALSYIEQRVAENLQSSGIPFALIAHDADRFIGTVSVIESDMEERPQYTPWVAALWVDDAYRTAGIGSALIDSAVEAAFKLGATSLYLCATPENSAFYEKRGWTIIEDGIDGLNIFKAKARG